jgi:hypothetical protein
MTTSRTLKRSRDDMDVDTGAAAIEDPGTELQAAEISFGQDIVTAIKGCFGSTVAFEMTGSEAKAEALALLGSADIRADILEREVLVPQVSTQLFRALSGEDAVVAAETAVCLKNLMTHEQLGNRCIRRLYALCIFPVLEGLIKRHMDNFEPASSPTIIESVAVMVMSIASLIPASLPQINSSSLPRLLKFVVSSGNEDQVIAAVLQSVLVCVEDNAELAELIDLDALIPAAVAVSPGRELLSALALSVVLNGKRCLDQRMDQNTETAITNTLRSLLVCPLPETPDSVTESDLSARFEVIDLAADCLQQVRLQSEARLPLSQLLAASNSVIEGLYAYWRAHFASYIGSDSDVSGARTRVSKRLWSALGMAIGLQEQLLRSSPLPKRPPTGFMERAVFMLKIGEEAALLAREHRDEFEDVAVDDEISGWMRAWLSDSWPASCDFPELPSDMFSRLTSLFLDSESPVVLTNCCAIVALLIPYLSPDEQALSCAFLNGLLATDPFDGDHLEILLGAVDAITGIFDPVSKEWPAKSLRELKNDLMNAVEKLRNAKSLNGGAMTEDIEGRLEALNRLCVLL